MCCVVSQHISDVLILDNVATHRSTRIIDSDSDPILSFSCIALIFKG